MYVCHLFGSIFYDTKPNNLLYMDLAWRNLRK